MSNSHSSVACCCGFLELLTVTFRGEKSARRKMARESIFELLSDGLDAARPVDQKMSPGIFSKNVFEDNKNWSRPGFEPGTSRTLSGNHTPRPTRHTPSSTLILTYSIHFLRVEKELLKRSKKVSCYLSILTANLKKWQK